MSSNRSDPRPNRIVHQVVLALAGVLGAACGDDSDSGEASDAVAHDAAHGGSGGSGGNGGSGSGGSSGASGSAGKAGSSSAGKGGAGGAGGAGGKVSDDATQEVTIRFKATVADRDFSCLDRYNDLGSKKTSMMPADFRFYVQDLKLIDANDKEVPVKLDTRAPWQSKDVALIDFEDAQGRCHGTAETNTTITGRVPRSDSGAYKGVVFSNGVPESLNHLEQSTQQPPLDVTDLFWTWLSGYRFVVAELVEDAADGGSASSADDAGAALPGIGLMHVGSTACRKDQGCTKPNRNLIRLSDFNPEKDVIVADLGAIFQDTDLSQDMQCHAADALCAPMFEQIGVRFDTGASLKEQKVYRVAAGAQ